MKPRMGDGAAEPAGPPRGADEEALLERRLVRALARLLASQESDRARADRLRRFGR